MMYNELYQYLLHHKQLTIPGIGTFLIKRKPAEADIASRIIKSPAYTTALHSTVDSSSKKLFDWLASGLNISDREAVIRFNDFAFDLKQKIFSGYIITWNGVGTLSKDSTSQIKFDSSVNTLMFEQPVAAQKVIRKTAEHTVLVGEQEKTSTQMTKLLSQPAKKRFYWWVYALVAGLLAMIFIFWYFSEHGLNITSTGNSKKLNTQKPAATYKILP
jgi:hypothetical protein